MRLPSAWFTAEDLEAWGLVCLRFKPRGPCWWYEKTRESDRRDAARMLFQMQLRDKLTPRGNYIRWMDLHPAADWRAECL